MKYFYPDPVVGRDDPVNDPDRALDAGAGGVTGDLCPGGHQHPRRATGQQTKQGQGNSGHSK